MSDKDVIMGDRIEYTVPGVDMSRYNFRIAGEHPHARAMKETARRVIDASFEEQRLESMGKLDDEDVATLIGAARSVSQFVARATGDVDAAVGQGVRILDLSKLMNR